MCENQTEQISTLSLYFEDFVLLLRFYHLVIYKNHVKVHKQLALRTSFAYCDQTGQTSFSLSLIVLLFFHTFQHISFTP